jgi:hypothetical protein
MDELQELKMLAGISNRPKWSTYEGYPGSNISVTGNEKAQLMRKNDIKPGTDAWFKLWFSLPYLTKETPI